MASKAIATLLVTLAEARQAAVTQTTLQVYDKRLQAFDLRDVRTAILALMETPRREGETAFPDLATLVIAVQRVQKARLNAWQKCEACASGMDGWQALYDDHGHRIGVTRCHCWKLWRARQAPEPACDRKSAAAGAA